MKISAIAFLMMTSAAVAGPFDTGDSFGPRSPSGETEGYSRTAPANPAVCRPNAEFESFTCYLSGPIGSGNAGTVLAAGATSQFPLTAAEVQAQIIVANEHERRMGEQLREDGGCNADYLPYWVAIFCGQKAFNAGHSGVPGSNH